MKPREFVQLAVELSRSTQPARLRTAVSRAYYGVFHEALQFLTSSGLQVSKGSNAHGEVRHRLANSGDSELVDLASQLDELHGKRIEADYRLDHVGLERGDEVLHVVTQARLMTQVLDACRTEPRRRQIIAGIRAWEQKLTARA